MKMKINYEVSNSVHITISVKEIFEVGKPHFKTMTTQVINELTDDKINKLIETNKESILKQVAEGLKQDSTWTKVIETDEA